VLLPGSALVGEARDKKSVLKNRNFERFSKLQFFQSAFHIVMTFCRHIDNLFNFHAKKINFFSFCLLFLNFLLFIHRSRWAQALKNRPMWYCSYVPTKLNGFVWSSFICLFALWIPSTVMICNNRCYVARHRKYHNQKEACVTARCVSTKRLVSRDQRIFCKCEIEWRVSCNTTTTSHAVDADERS